MVNDEEEKKDQLEKLRKSLKHPTKRSGFSLSYPTARLTKVNDSLSYPTARLKPEPLQKTNSSKTTKK